jgi:alpha-beta hydrolase superfamily lysophospholipase
MNFKICFFFFIAFTQYACASLSRYEIPSEATDLIYYLEVPSKEQYSLILAVEGSYVYEKGLESVLRLHYKIADRFLENGFGLVTMEKRGIDGKKVDPDKFHYFNTPTQRLNDHLQLIAYLRKNPPKNWNGKLIILGGSEGGPIAIKLSSKVHSDGCIVLVGCGDQTFKEYSWQFIQEIKDSNPDLPQNRNAYEEQIAKMKENPDSHQFWLGQTYRYWADALDQKEDLEFYSLQCPTLVVAGSIDIECPSTERLIENAKNQNKPVQYLRIEGMGHDVLEPKWHVMDVLMQFLKNHF